MSSRLPRSEWIRNLSTRSRTGASAAAPGPPRVTRPRPPAGPLQQQQAEPSRMERWPWDRRRGAGAGATQSQGGLDRWWWCRRCAPSLPHADAGRGRWRCYRCRSSCFGCRRRRSSSSSTCGICAQARLPWECQHWFSKASERASKGVREQGSEVAGRAAGRCISSRDWELASAGLLAG